MTRPAHPSASIHAAAGNEQRLKKVRLGTDECRVAGAR
jgi:hypothetical protein